MGKKWLIGGAGVLAIMSLGVVTYGVVLGGAPDLTRVVGEAILPHEKGGVDPAGAVHPSAANAAAAAAPPVETAAGSESGRRLSPHEAARPVTPKHSTMTGPFSAVAFDLPVRDGTRIGGLSVPGEIDYRDPVENGAVPLVPVWDRMDEAVSPHFRVRDFAARDGAAFARISPELVDVLDKLYEHIGAPVHITSAYRHPALNFRTDIRGAHESRHMAGLAADVWVEGKTPLEIVQAALETHGCHMGVGLGSDFIHIDLRGYTASWAYEGAEMDEADFDLWMLDRCAESFGEQARLLAERRSCLEPLTGMRAAEAHRIGMTAFARDHRNRGIVGAVLVDVRAGFEHERDGTAAQMAFLPVDSPLIRLMDLEAVIQRAERNNNFVFVLIEQDGAHRTGLMRYDGEQSAAFDAPAEEVTACG